MSCFVWDSPLSNCLFLDSLELYQSQGRENEMTVVSPERGNGYLLDAGEGDAYWLLGMLEIVKISGAETGGAFGMVEVTVRAGEGSPWHVHPEEDEWFTCSTASSACGSATSTC